MRNEKNSVTAWKIKITNLHIKIVRRIREFQVWNLTIHSEGRIVYYFSQAGNIFFHVRDAIRTYRIDVFESFEGKDRDPGLSKLLSKLKLEPDILRCNFIRL